jgi:16S rRNA (cytosine967-C5)-methyltransferase
VAWPDDATRLSYPDWIVERLVADLGHDAAIARWSR